METNARNATSPTGGPMAAACKATHTHTRTHACMAWWTTEASQADNTGSQGPEQQHNTILCLTQTHTQHPSTRTWAGRRDSTSTVNKEATQARARGKTQNTILHRNSDAAGQDPGLARGGEEGATARGKNTLSRSHARMAVSARREQESGNRKPWHVYPITLLA